MKAASIAIVLCIWLQQTELLEKQALSLVQRTPAFDLDPALPNVSLGTWFNQLVGSRAGVIWQLSECGEAIAGQNNEGTDLPACMEANAILANGRKVVIAIQIGTFKKGLAGKASFHFGAVEYEKKLLPVKRLSELPKLLSAPSLIAGNKPVALPDIDVPEKRIKWLPQINSLSLLASEKDVLMANLDSEQGSSPPEDVPPPPNRLHGSSSSNQPQSIQILVDEVLDGHAITRVGAVYPNARLKTAFEMVQVQITISETGRVIEARAISGQQALRSAAVKAALKWVFRPITLNGSPIKVQGVLRFKFKGNQ
jgi:TonB family protein